jgi:hypothetical protein
MNEVPSQIQDAKARLEQAMTLLQGATVPNHVGVPIMAALKVAKNRIHRLESLLEDKYTMRDRFAMNIVAHLMVTRLYEPKEAIRLAYELAGEAEAVRI